MAKNNKSLAEEALLEMDSIKSAIKEESKNTLKLIMEDAVKDALRDSVKDDEDDYEVEEPKDSENKTGKKSATKKKQQLVDNAQEPVQKQQPAQTPVSDGEQAPMGQEQGQEPNPQEMNAENDEWSEFGEYMTPEGNVDLTSVDDADFGKVLKAWKLLNNDDQVVIRQEGDKLHLKDNECGTEYLIDLETGSGEGGEEPMGLNEDVDLGNDDELTDDELASLEPYDDSEDFGDGEVEPEPEEIEDVDVDQLNSDFEDMRRNGIAGFVDDDYDEFDFDDDLDVNNLYENKNNKKNKTMKEGKVKETIFEVDLGYTDRYQDEDPIQGLSADEPSKSGRSWDKGVPTGTKKPWAGNTKSKGDPFEKTVNEETEFEVDVPDDDAIEENTTVAKAQKRHKVKTHSPETDELERPHVGKSVSTAEDGYKAELSEMKSIYSENRKLKNAIRSLKKDLNEAYITNVNLGKITKLFLENTTSQNEKREIINRFDKEAKTVEQSKALYESIKKQLNKNVKKNVSLNEGTMTANKTMVNEAKANIPNEFANMIDLMKRMG